MSDGVLRVCPLEAFRVYVHGVEAFSHLVLRIYGGWRHLYLALILRVYGRMEAFISCSKSLCQMEIHISLD
jgi:hypothetical protein